MEETPLKTPPTTVHTLLTLAKLVQTIRFQVQEEKKNAPHPPTDPTAESPTNSQPAIPMEPTHAPSAKPTGSFAGASAEATSKCCFTAATGGDA